MANIITFRCGAQLLYVSCVSVTPPAKIAYSSSERAVDAIKLPYAVALGICDMLNYRWSLGASIASPKPCNG